MAEFPLMASADAATQDLPNVRDTLVVLEDITPDDRLVIVRLSGARVGVRKLRADDPQSMAVHRLRLAPEGRGFSLIQIVDLRRREMRELITGRTPAVGDLYWAGDRTFVLGESHYRTEGCALPSFTENVVNYHVRRHPRPHQGSIFARSGRLLRGMPPHSRIPADELRSVFDGIMFANYVPAIMETRHHRPTPEQWRSGGPILQAILDGYEPERILVLGIENWGRIPAPHSRDHVAISSELSIERRWYRAAGRLVPAVHIRHPAAPGWRYAEWLPVVQALLGMESKPESLA